MPVWKVNNQVCATCKYWCGERKIDFKGHSYETLSEEGTCGNSVSVYRANETKEYDTCPVWEKF